MGSGQLLALERSVYTQVVETILIGMKPRYDEGHMEEIKVM